MSDHSYNINSESGEIHIRHGQLLAQPVPKNICYTTNIYGPAEWFEKREHLMDFDHCHIIVEEHEEVATIKFVEKERDQNGFTEITGRLEQHPVFANLKISHEFGSPEALGKHLKKNKRFLSDPIKGEELISALFSFTAKIDQRLERSQDNRGNNRAVYESAIKTEIPQYFTLEVPLFKGSDEKFVINFEICIAYAENRLICWFESDELDQIIQDEKEHIITTELDNFDSSIPVLKK